MVINYTGILPPNLIFTHPISNFHSQETLSLQTPLYILWIPVNLHGLLNIITSHLIPLNFRPLKISTHNLTIPHDKYGL